MNKESKIYVAGHDGMVGSALCRKLKKEGYFNIITKSLKDLDLMNQKDVELFFKENLPEYVFLAAAKVGGIMANNTYSAEFLYDNLMIQCNVINCAYKYNVKKLLFLGSSCIYPKNCPQPIKEEYLLTGLLEPTNEAYAIAKISGIKMCQHYNKQYGTNFISIMPTNLYGPNDNFNLETSHVFPALIRKFHEGKINYQNGKNNMVEIWGSGKPKREFLHVDDMADASVYIMNNVNANDISKLGITHINVGTGKDITISELVNVMKEIIGYKGKIIYDKTKPDGIDQKLLDISRLKSLGWEYKISLKDGISKTYKWYLENKRK